jgi:hypothetical protein
MAKRSSHVLEMARKGATHRYQELKAEITALMKAFPHLEFGSAISPAAPKAEFDRIRKAGKRKKMSAAARKAVSARMKKYWAARRKAARS